MYLYVNQPPCHALACRAERLANELGDKEKDLSQAMTKCACVCVCVNV